MVTDIHGSKKTIMMLVVGNGAAEDQQSKEKDDMMMDHADGNNDNDDNLLLQKPSNESHGEGESGDETGMSSSAMSVSETSRSLRTGKRRENRETGGAPSNHHQRRDSESPSRGRRQDSKSPIPKEEVDGKESRPKASSSSAKVRPRGGRISKTRSSAADEDPPASSHERKTRSGRNRNSLAADKTPSSAEHQHQQREGEVEVETSSSSGAKIKASSSSREGKSYKSNSTNSRSGHGERTTSTREGSKHRRRKLSPHRGSEKKPEKDGDKEEGGDNDSNPAESLPLTTEASDSRHRTKRPSSSGRPRRRSKSGSRSIAKVTAANGNGDKKEESTLDSTSDSGPEPKLSIRSSVKVASALVKFRMVLAKSKYHTNQDKQANHIDMANVLTGHKENLKNGTTSSRHKRDSRRDPTTASSSHHKRDASRHKSSRHRREAKDEDGALVKRKSSKESNDSTASSRRSTKMEETQPATTPDNMLMNALSNVGRKLAKEKAERKNSAPETKVATKTAATQEKKSSVRLESSAKVSTAMLKFQQALALSKSATAAAKTRQDTQNKLLGEVHAGTKPVATPDDYRLKFQKSSASTTRANVSPVSTVDIVEPSNAKDSPKVPTDLDGDSDKDLDCDDSSIDKSKRDDDGDMSMSGSEVEIDSDDEMDSDIDSECDIGDLNDKDDSSEVNSDSESEAEGPESKPVVVVTPKANATIAGDMDLDSSISDHSSVVLDSDDDLDSDGEFGDDDVEDDVESEDDTTVEKGEAEVFQNNVDFEELLTPEQSSWDGNTDAVLVHDESGSQKEGETPTNAGGGSDKVTQISQRLKIVRSLSFTTSNSGGLSSSSILDRSLSEWRPSSSRDITKRAGLNLAIPGLSPGILPNEDSSQPSLSYLPIAMKHIKPKVPDESDDDIGEEQPKGKLVDQDKRSSSLTRKASSRSLRKSKSVVESSTRADAGKQLLDDGSSGSRRRTSRTRKPPSRSHSSCGAAVKAGLEGEMQSERKSKPSFSSSAARSKSRERSSTTKRSSSASRAKTLAGVSALVETASSSDPRREENRKPSSRRKTPNRAKSHDTRTRSSRATAAAAPAAAADKGEIIENESRRSSRKSNVNPLDDLM